ncbi:MAG: ABC transporter substrate-binding protein [Campylobacterales bacterium]|nr:ABC transporter substrate-binding protein [Campylobacterales bacterium]
MKKLLLLSLFLVTILWSNEPITLQLSWLHQFQFAGFYVAKEKGYYRDAGLDVTIEDAQNKRDPLKTVMQGNAQYAVGHTSLLVNSMQGSPIILMAAMFQSSPEMLLVREDSGIKSAKDLRGKRIMLTADAANGVEIQAMLRSVGLTPKDYILQPHSYNPRSLEHNETDAMAAYLSNEPFVLDKMGIKTHAIHPKEYGFDFYSDILFSSQKEYREHPERMAQFYNASMRGWHYAFTHIDETAELIYRAYNPQHKSLESLIYEGNSLKQLAYRPNISFGEIDPIRLEMMVQGYRLMGSANTPFSSEALIYKNTTLQLSNVEKQWLKEHPIIRVGIDKNRPPISFLDTNGKYLGVSASYLKLLEKQLGVTFVLEYSRSNWSDSLKGINHRELDMLSYATIITKQKNDLHLSNSYMKESLVIVANSNVGYVHDLNDLRGKRIAVARSYATDLFLKKEYPKLQIILSETPLDALKKVSAGEADACVEGLSVVSYLINQYDLKGLKVVGETPYQYEYAFAFRNDWEILSKITDKVLASISQKDYEEIHGHWLVMKIQAPIDYFYIWLSVGIAMIIFLLILYKNRTLDKLVRYRTAELEVLNEHLQEEIKKAVLKNRTQEKILMQQAKMAEIGSMLESIAHQWRQPLNILGISMSNLSLGLALGKPENIENTVEIVEQQIQYMSQTIDDFRNFFKQDLAQKRININDTLNEIETLIGPLLRRNDITLVRNIDPSITLFVYPNELKQVLLNIINNGREAIEHAKSKNREISVRCENNSHFCTISIEDTGGGVPLDIIDKLFDPYFTTKFESQGTGIGLYMAKVIIEKHFFGKLRVYNTERGACFEIQLNHSEDTVA